jgi:hypothetical protein
MKQKLIPLIPERSNKKGKIIMADLCGPFWTRSLNECDNFLSIVKTFSQYLRIYPIPVKQPKRVLKYFLDYVAEVKQATGKKIVMLLSDGGGKFSNGILIRVVEQRV